jgi:hypothetical protein
MRPIVGLADPCRRCGERYCCGAQITYELKRRQGIETSESRTRSRRGAVRERGYGIEKFNYEDASRNPSLRSGVGCRVRETAMPWQASKWISIALALVCATVPVLARPEGNEQTAVDFLLRYLAMWSAPNSQALPLMQGIYLDRASFYGEVLPHEALMKVKRRFAARWPGSCPTRWCRNGTPWRVGPPYQAAMRGRLTLRS